MAENKTYTLESAKELFAGDNWDTEVAKMPLEEMMSLDNAIYGKPISENIADESSFVRQEAAKRIEAIAGDPDSFNPDDLNSIEDFVKQFAGNSSNGQFNYATDAARSVMEKITKQRKEIEEKATEARTATDENTAEFVMGDESNTSAETSENTDEASNTQETSATEEAQAEEVAFPELTAQERVITEEGFASFMDPLEGQLPEETPEELKRQEERLDKILELQKVNPYRSPYEVSKIVNGTIDFSAGRRLAVSDEEISLESLNKAREADAERVTTEYYDAIFGICKGKDEIDKETPEQHFERMGKIAECLDKKLPKAEIYKALGINPTEKQEKQASAVVYQTNMEPYKKWAGKLGNAGLKALDIVRDFEKANPAVGMAIGMFSAGNPIYMGARMVLSARGLYKDYENYKNKNDGKVSFIGMMKDKETRNSMKNNAGVFIRSLPVVGQAYSAYGMAKQLTGVFKKQYWKDLKNKTIEAKNSIVDVAKNPKDAKKWGTMLKNVQKPLMAVAIVATVYGAERMIENYVGNDAPDNTPDPTPKTTENGDNGDINAQIAADRARLAEMGVNPELTDHLGPDALRTAILQREMELDKMGLGKNEPIDGGTLDEVVVTAKKIHHEENNEPEIKVKEPEIKQPEEVKTPTEAKADDFSIEGMTHDNMAAAGVDQQTALGLEDAMVVGKANGDFSQAEEIIKGLDGDAKLAAQDYLNAAKGLSATGGEEPNDAFFNESTTPSHLQMYNLAAKLEGQLEADGKIDANSLLREEIANGTMTPEQAASAGGIMTEIYTKHDGNIQETINDIKNGAMDGALEEHEAKQAAQEQAQSQEKELSPEDKEMVKNLKEPWEKYEAQVNEAPIMNKPTEAPVYEGEKEELLEAQVNEAPIMNKPTEAPVYQGEKEADPELKPINLETQKGTENSSLNSENKPEVAKEEPKQEVKEEPKQEVKEEIKPKEEVKEEVKQEAVGHQTDHLPAEELKETPAMASARIKEEFMGDGNGKSSVTKYVDGSTMTKYSDSHGVAEITQRPDGQIVMKEFGLDHSTKTTEFNKDGTKDITETDKFGQKTITQVDEKGEAKTTSPEENGTAKTPEEQKAYQEEKEAQGQANLKRYEELNKEIGRPKMVEYNGRTCYEYMGIHGRNAGHLEMMGQEKVLEFSRTEVRYQELDHKLASGETLTEKEQAFHKSHEKLADRLGLEKDAEGKWKNHENAARSHKEADFRSDKQEYQDLNRQKEDGTLDKDEKARLKEVEKELKSDHGMSRKDLRELRAAPATAPTATQQTTVNLNIVDNARGQTK